MAAGRLRARGTQRGAQRAARKLVLLRQGSLCIANKEVYMYWNFVYEGLRGTGRSHPVCMRA